jgi:hypothetical protein
VLVRAFGLHFGTGLAARLARASSAIGRYVGPGLLPQAGLAIALAQLLGRTFPGFGASAAELVLAIVAVNQLIAPALFRLALVRSGEAGAAPTSDAREIEVAPVQTE